MLIDQGTAGDLEEHKPPRDHRGMGAPLLFVEGSADLTRAKQICHYNLARVLHEDHRAASFVDGRCSRRYVANADVTGDLFDRPPCPATWRREERCRGSA